MPESISDLFKQNPVVAGGIGIMILCLVVVSGILLVRQFQNSNKTPEVMVVSFGDGQNEVTVQRNGQVTIKTPHGTFYQTWDKEKIRQFFTNLDNLNFDLLSKFIGTDVAIKLTLNDGQEIIISIDEHTEEIANQLQEVLDETYEEEVELVPPILIPADIDDPGTPVLPSSEPTPTPSDDLGGGSGGGGSSNPWQSGGDPEDDQEVFDCDQYDPVTGKKVIISNTVCAQ